MLLQILAATSIAASATVTAGPRAVPIGFVAPADSVAAAADTVKKRRRAVEYDDAYYTRLQIHRIASYTELPLFGVEYVLGERLIKEEQTGFPSNGLKTAHNVVALGLGGLFALNTVTGVWNFWDSRHDLSGLTVVHSALMLGADAGFALAGATGGSANQTINDSNRHRSIALTSMGIATAGTAIMWFFHH